MSALKIPAKDLPKFKRRMLSWFAKCKRDLPWRRTKDSYRIWLSEIMLQQTRVAAVIPYYERFVEKFPDVHALANAPSDHVLKNWAGLGYYSRAKNLQSAAKEIVVRHSGEFPRKYEAALALPGIGRYTAAAVLSIAYDAPHAVLDGNVARVLARIFALRGDLRAPATWHKLEAAAQELLAQKISGDWNQAMMELGATVCTPKSPRCDECPVKEWCSARKLGIAEKLPSPRKKRASVDVTLAVAVLLDPDGRTLLIRQMGGDGALFSRMWQFPALEAVGTHSKLAIAAYLKEKFRLATNGNLLPMSTARHTVTFRNIRLEPYLVRVAHLPRIVDTSIAALTDVPTMSISNATRKIANVALADAALSFFEQ
ncbi:MAG TPA: A/G-specific adenine glycosylase [Candidatus Saccharimonadales bacterium]|nr:A/G-specific adenine glycosylase [Candidatus Saccharimonadales bacterium]